MTSSAIGIFPGWFNTYPVVISNTSCPQPQHAPEWDEDTEEIGDQEHGLCLEFEVPLNVPEPKCRGGRASGLCDAKVGELQKGKGNVVILDDVDESSCGFLAGCCSKSRIKSPVNKHPEEMASDSPVVLSPSASRKRDLISRIASQICLNPIVA